MSIKVGDIMVLLSGSLPMVVQDIDQEEILCVWFSNGESRSAIFNYRILAHIEHAEIRQIFER